MDILQKLHDKAVAAQKTIVLSEGSDRRVIEAAIIAANKGLAKIILIGNKEQITTHAAKIPENLIVEEPTSSNKIEQLAQHYFDLRKHKGVSMTFAQRAVLEPHIYAALLVNAGFANGCLGGAATTTAEIVRTAIQLIGKDTHANMISSFFLMLLDKDFHEKKDTLLFADCALVIDPNSKQLADIAITSASSLRQLVGKDPKVAMLSFSTQGSAKHEKVNKVADATKIIKARAPEVPIDGEVQFDAAFVPEVAKTKIAGSMLAGNANIFIFPDLNSGNIAYKIAQRLGGAIALGPILQGLAKPANDLSRGCSIDDIVNMIAITAVQASN